ncbi:hypothetical protein ACLOJK_017533 [Asimina triloba]
MISRSSTLYVPENGCMASNAKSFFRFSLSFVIDCLLKSLASPPFLNEKVNAQAPTSKLPKCHPLTALEQRHNHIKILVIDVEGALLRSSSLFPYFMAVAFEGGGLMRALILLVLYPFISLLSKPMALKAMIMVSFCGIKEDGFRLGRSVLHKLFLEDVSLEGFEALMKGERRVAVSGLPRVMVEGFLKEYLEVGVVLGRELKVKGGLYVGVMEEDDEKRVCVDLEKAFDGEVGTGDVVGIRSLDKGAVDHHVFSQCKVCRLVSLGLSLARFVESSLSLTRSRSRALSLSLSLARFVVSFLYLALSLSRPRNYLSCFLSLPKALARIQSSGGVAENPIAISFFWRTPSVCFGNHTDDRFQTKLARLGKRFIGTQIKSRLKQEIHRVTEADRRNCHLLPRHKYPKPLIFHDGRLAFKPTPLAMMTVLIWFPFCCILAIFRAFVGRLLPYKITIPILSFTGMKLRLKTTTHSSNSSSPSHTKRVPKGSLYVSNHRTLLDPLYLSTCLNRSVTAVTYSISRISEIVSPIKTVGLSRNREVDRKIMEDHLRQGDLFVCPEGTTCREAYLLRLSPLFGEMECDIELAAMDTHVDFFYGTTASGLKWLDPLFFLMNPWPSYCIELLGRLGKECGCSEGSLNSRSDLAMLVQREMGRALGFECTGLTRKDKYLMLAGNEGFVSADNRYKKGVKMPKN